MLMRHVPIAPVKMPLSMCRTTAISPRMVKDGNASSFRCSQAAPFAEALKGAFCRSPQDCARSRRHPTDQAEDMLVEMCNLLDDMRDHLERLRQKPQA